MNTLNIVVDVGASETKVLYGFDNDKKVNYFSIAPEIQKIALSVFKDYLNEVSSTQELFGISGVVNPLKQLWIQEFDSVIAVGDLAVSLEAKNNLTQQKYENAAYKIMAVLGIVLEKNNLIAKSDLTINLGTLLPIEELSDSQRFENFLRDKLKSYIFRDMSVKINLNKFICKPEGAGLVLARCKLKGQSHFAKSKIGVLMLGHRNVTSLYFDSGVLKKSSSPLLGFAFMICSIKKATFGLDEASIIQKFYQAWKQSGPYQEPGYPGNNETLPELISSKSHDDHLHYPEWLGVYCLKDLTKAENKDLRLAEAKDLGKAIDFAQKKYIGQIFSWLKENLPPCDEVIISGGSAIFLKPFLEFYFNYAIVEPSSRHESSSSKTFRRNMKSTPIIWNTDIRKTIGEMLNMRNELTLLRLEDAFGLYVYLTSLKPS